MRTNRPVIAASLTALALLTAGCSSTSSTTSAGAGAGSTTPAASTSASSSMTDTMSARPSTGGDMTKPFGAACANVPASGKGSFTGMATDPVATAASNNPLLSTLVAAVGAAGLGDTLNGLKDVTVFAPSNDAFAKIKPADLAALLKNNQELTKILTHHVVPKRLTAADLATGGPFKTVAGDEIKTAGSGESFTIGGGGAKVLCGNVQTANATVYIIDSVLTPGM